MFGVLKLLCDVLELKWNLGLRIRDAYQKGDFSSMIQIADVDIPELINRILIFKEAFYYQWMSENKSNGYQTHDLRIGGLIERLKTVQTLIRAYLNQEINVISELEETLLPMDENASQDMLLWTTWKRIHSLYVI